MLDTMVSVTEDVGATTGCRLPIDRFEVPFTGRSYWIKWLEWIQEPRHPLKFASVRSVTQFFHLTPLQKYRSLSSNNSSANEKNSRNQRRYEIFPLESYKKRKIYFFVYIRNLNRILLDHFTNTRFYFLENFRPCLEIESFDDWYLEIVLIWNQFNQRRLGSFVTQRERSRSNYAHAET